MNMLNYLRGKISKVQIDSPTKKPKTISSFQEIYLEQISLYIQVGGGYDVLKQKLFRDINQNYMVDSPLVQQIVIILRKALQSQQKVKQRRAITIIQDLVANCGKVMNQAFNDSQFCKVLANCCVYLRNLKSADRDELRQRACGIFLYWHQKLSTEPTYIYHQYYAQLKKKNAEFPPIPYIKQARPKLQSAGSITKQQMKNVSLVISECEELGANTERLLKQDKTKINTDFVRLLKTKTKNIYAISTSNQLQLTAGQKQRLNSVYKKIRSLLKEIEVLNEASARQQALEKQKLFLQEKMEVTSPKKSQKQIPKIAGQTSALKSNKKLQLEQINLVGTGKHNNKQEQFVEKKAEEQIVYNIDLLDIETKNTKIISSKKQLQKPVQKSPIKLGQQMLEQMQMRTPPKQKKNNYQQLLDLQVDSFQSPASEKKINFKQIYSASSLSPQLDGLDLIGGSAEKIKSKQSIKSSEQEAEFGDFA